VPLGLPCDLTWYKLLTDWGSLLSGFLALLAGGLAYVAGIMQANATREAVARQLAAHAAARATEIADIRAAVRTEVIAAAKFVVGALSICEGVAHGGTLIPRSDANVIVAALQEPIVFPAVADRIAALANPHLLVQFYGRVGEARALARTLASATVPAPPTNPSSPVVLVTRENVLVIADALVTALQLARAIIANVPGEQSPEEAFVTARTLVEIDAAETAAKSTFPDAESFTEDAAAEAGG